MSRSFNCSLLNKKVGNALHLFTAIFTGDQPSTIPVTILKCLYICVDHICYKDFTELMELCTEQPDGMTVVHFQL